MQPGLPLVQGDFEAFRRVVRGLIDNAIKYTPEGGRVVVSAYLVDPRVAISVKDNGPGIPPADVPHVFEKFYRAGSSASELEGEEPHSSNTAAPGVGLGLYLARHIIEQCGGQITVESKVGSGTIFTVLLLLFLEGGDSETIEDDVDVEAIVSS